MMNPEESYKYDATFHRVVDLMRAHLSVYEITPSELRQAAILAATMHEAQRVKPLFTRSYFPAQPWEVFIDEAKDISPAMFGGEQIDKSKWGVGMVGAPIRSLLTDKNPEYDLKCVCGYQGTNKDLHNTTCKHYNWNFYHTNTPQEKRTCICGYTGTMAELHSSACTHSSACKHYNWGIDHPAKPEHCHIFSVCKPNGDWICTCGISETYYNWAYNKKY